MVASLRSASRVGVWFAASLALGACGAPPPPAPPPAAPAPRPAALPATESEIGGMNEDAVVKAFERLAPGVVGCIEAGSKRVKELGGTFVVSLRIDREGRAKWAYLSESNLGDRAAERCVLEKAREHAWPHPVGGDGLAKRSFQIDPPSAPTSLEAKRVEPALKQAANAFARCRKGARGTFIATAYVRGDGRIVAAGVTPPGEDHEEAADCLADAVKKLKLGSPGRKTAKVTFELP